MTDTIRDRVNRGAAWLDEIFGSDWPDFIDRDELDLASSRRCVLGQLFANAEHEDGRPFDYTSGYLSVTSSYDGGLGLNVTWSERHGFTSFSSFRGLQEAWEDYLDEYEILQEIA